MNRVVLLIVISLAANVVLAGWWLKERGRASASTVESAALARTDVEGKEARDQVERNKESLDADLAAALGAEKSRDYKRSQDYGYSELTRLARKNDLPTDIAGKVYDFKDAAEAAAKQLKADTSLNDAERQAALAKIRDETQQAVIDTLGGTMFTNYIRRGGYWINNLAPTARPAR